jgi:hypothetical protein
MPVAEVDEAVARDRVKEGCKSQYDWIRVGRLVHHDDELVAGARAIGEARPEIVLIGSSGDVE